MQPASGAHAKHDPRALLDALLIGYTTRLPYHRGKWRVAEAMVRWGRLQSFYRGLSFQVERAGVRWELYPECMVQRSVYLWGRWESNDTREFLRLLSAQATVIDIGAYFGYYSLLASATTGGAARVIAFEPYLPSFRMLQRNIALNDFPQLDAVNLAVSAGAGTASFRVPPDTNRGSGGLTRDAAAGVTVATVALDEFIAARGIDHVDVIKIDAEGSEIEVISGAQQVIAAHRPAMMVEVDPGKLRLLGHTPQQLIRLLRGLNYELWSPVRSGLARATDAVLTPDGFLNLICLPRTHA
jgi:FkbM family methyltransferase